MPIVAHAQCEHIEARHLRAFQPKLRADRRLVTRRSRIGFELTFDAKNLLRLQRNLAEHRLPRHTVIAVGMIRWDTALIHPKEFEMRPGHGLEKPLLRTSEEPKGLLRCIPSRDRDARPATRRYRRLCSFQNMLGCCPCQGIRPIVHTIFDYRLSSHVCSALKCYATDGHPAQSAHRPPSAPMSRPYSWGNLLVLPSPTLPAQACTTTTSPPRRRDAQTTSDRRASRQAEAVHSHSQNLHQMLLHIGNP